MTLRELCAALDVDPSTIFRWIKKGHVTPKQVPNEASGKGYVLAFTAADLAKLKKLDLKPGRKAKEK